MSSGRGPAKCGPAQSPATVGSQAMAMGWARDDAQRCPVGPCRCVEFLASGNW